MSGLLESPEPEAPRAGCATRLGALLIAFFVNVPLVNVGPRRLWSIAPVLLLIAVVVDVFLLLLVALWLWQRRQAPPVDPPVPH